MLDRYFEAHPIGAVRYVPQFPVFTDRTAWEQVAPADREALIAYAESWHGKPWPVITAGMYASFVRTGSRRDCENPYFERRRRLCSAVLHVCLTGETTLLPDVEDGVLLLCEETSWAISAHLGLTREQPFPDDANTVLDLFAAQTGMILSFTAQLLEGVLHPDLHARIQREVERRVLTHFMENNGEWWMGYVRKDLNNWTPWIISNVLMAANVWHFGGAALVERACMMLDRWLNVVPEDGGCDEGAGYWNMAGGAFLDCLMALESLCCVDLWQDEKVRRMMAYPELVYLGKGWFANFADCDARPYISGERLQYAGEKTGNPALVRMGAEMWGSPLKELNDTPHLSRVLMRIFARPAQVENTAVGPKDVYLPDLQVRLVQRGGMIAAMKGGHNDESHNHNDVGSFLIMANGDMQLVDAGNMVYTAKTFSDRRYELWNCRADYHNV
ncbi:MAG: heparinase II/III family protein, partial [Clostridia bacterium]|nr:heparinase II/III family protein [Clostridia bacterium]